jgi:UDP-GlcNAc:undecaprenyl-phosphate GlcNAc-1-phosphate transferase
MFWLVACTNAFNLIDGVDGLASGVALSATLTTFAAAVLQSDSGLALATAPVAGALLGFLRYNFNPASIFLGVSGSLWLGFLLGCYGAVWSQKSATVLGMTAPLMALSIPLLDTALAIIRRFLRGEPVFGADLAHIHHRLLNRGLTPRRVALLLYGASGVAACFALTQSIVRNELRGLVLVLFCAAAWIGIRHLGYREFEVAARLIPLRHFRKSLEEQLRVSRFEDDLRTAVSIEDCWRAIHDAARDLGFTHVSANIARHSYDVGLGVSKDEHWTLRVPLSEADYVTLTHDGRYPGVPAVIAYFAESLHNSLRAKPLSFGAHTPRPPAVAATAGRT